MKFTQIICILALILMPKVSIAQKTTMEHSIVVEQDIDYLADNMIDAKDIIVVTNEEGQTEVCFRCRPLVRGGAAIIRGTARAGRFVIRGTARVIRGTLYVGGKVIRGVGKVITREAYCVTVTLKDGKTINFVRYGQVPRTLLWRLNANKNVDGVLDIWGYSTSDGVTQFRARVPSETIMNITVVPCTTVYMQ